MHRYIICNMSDERTYEKQCVALEKNIPELTKLEELKDVDGSKYMLYTYRGHTITVKNSYYLGEVLVESEIALEPFFKKRT